MFRPKIYFAHFILDETEGFDIIEPFLQKIDHREKPTIRIVPHGNTDRIYIFYNDVNLDLERINKEELQKEKEESLKREGENETKLHCLEENL